MTTTTELHLPTEASGLLSVGELAGILTSRFRRFRVEAHSDDRGFATAFVTVQGYVTADEVAMLLDWCRAVPFSRSLSLPTSEGDAVCVSIRYAEGDE